MRFREGYLGIVVVMVALAGAIIGGWALSTDIEENTVTGYNYLADITGLFETSQAPEFIDYSPSTNYTGYYTEDSDPYFDGVDYASSARANQYRLNLEPTVYGSGNLTLSTYSGTDPFSGYSERVTFAYIKEDNGYTRTRANTTGTTVTLSSYITAMGLSSDVDKVIFKSLSDLDADDYDVSTAAVSVDWVLFTVSSQWYLNNSYYVCVVGTEDYIQSMGYSVGSTTATGAKIYTPWLSCIVDLSTGTATVYSDNDCQDKVGIFNTADMIMTYGGSGTSSASYPTYINLDDTVYYQAQESDVVYMDPSAGVELL